ncbi:MAG: hypothetical protein V9G29_02900 [Burkholderiaceae bacterium]
MPAFSNTGIKLLEVAASSSNAGSATLKLGTKTDDDAYMTAKVIGVSNEPTHFTVKDFDGALGRPAQRPPARSTRPRPSSPGRSTSMAPAARLQPTLTSSSRS